MQWVPGKKIYFLSDFHLGAPNEEQSLLREKRIVRFLQNEIGRAHVLTPVTRSSRMPSSA